MRYPLPFASNERRLIRKVTYFPMRIFSGLWRHPDFLKLWAGQTVSLFGSQITLLALPLTAVVTLQASTLDMGWLRFATTLPTLLFGLIIGIWIDRLRRRAMLIFADLGRALLLGSIPLAQPAHALRRLVSNRLPDAAL